MFSLNHIKDFYRRNRWSLSLTGIVFLAIGSFITISFATHYSQTVLNYAAAPAKKSSLSNTIKQPKPVTDMEKLEKYLTVEAALLGVSDNVSLYFEDLNLHKEITIDPTRSWIPASTIKAYVALEAFRQRSVGLIDFNQVVTIKAQNVVPTELETSDYPMLRQGTQATIKQLVEAMVTQSDNTAYNTLLDILDRRSINATLQSLGFTETVVGEKLNLDDEQFQQDLAEPGRQPNTTTVKDLAYLFELLYTKQVPDSEELLSIFKRQKINSMLPALIPASTEIAHKTGDWAPIYHDGGLIYKSDDPFIFVVFTNSNDPTIIAKLAHVAYYQTPESIGQNLDRDKAMIPTSHFITSNSLLTPVNPNVLGAKTAITSSQKYVVQEGDSLSSIASKFYGDANRWPDIARRNYLSSPTDIIPGQTLIIPSVKVVQQGSYIMSPEISAADLGITSSDLTVDTVDAKNFRGAAILPGSPFYQLKLSLESLAIAGAMTPTDKVNAYLAFANSRLSEVKTLLSQGNTQDVDELLTESDNALSSAVSLAKSSDVPQEEFIKIKKVNDLHFAVLAENISHVPSQDKVKMIDTIYNFYKKIKTVVTPVLKASVVNNPISQEPIIGTVDSVHDNTATIKFDNGQTKDVTLTTETTVRDFHEQLPDQNLQLQSGTKIAVIEETTKDNKIIPRFILRNIPKGLPDRHEGTIIRVFPQKNTLEIINNKGQKEEVHVDNTTVIRSKDTGVSLEGITPGSQVTIFGEQKENQNQVNLFVPTQLPTQGPDKDYKNGPGDKKPDNNHSSQTNQSSFDTKQTTVINATSVTVTKNSSGAKTQVITQTSPQQAQPSSNNNSNSNNNGNNKDSSKNTDKGK